MLLVVERKHSMHYSDSYLQIPTWTTRSIAMFGFSESIWTRPTARGPSGHKTRSIVSPYTAGPGTRAPRGPRTQSTVGSWAPSSAAPSPSFCLVQQHKGEDKKGPKQSSHHRQLGLLFSRWVLLSSSPEGTKFRFSS